MKAADAVLRLGGAPDPGIGGGLKAGESGDLSRDRLRERLLISKSMFSESLSLPLETKKEKVKVRGSFKT